MSDAAPNALPERLANAPVKLQVTDVNKSFGPKQVLRGATVDIRQGESLVVIGGSGTGKSVLLKCILGLLRPDSGSIQIEGTETVGLTGTAREDVLSDIGMLFQAAALFDSLTIWENVAFSLTEGRNMPVEEAKPIALETLGRVGLDESVAAQYPAELSGGMQKRVGLARAIASRPSLLFFDEPTTGLDPIMGDIINNLIAESVSELGASTLTITHDMSSARIIADRVAMIYAGEFIWHGPADQLGHTGNAMLDQFIHGNISGPIDVTGR